MAIVPLDEFNRYDAVLDGMGLMLEPEAEKPYDLQAPDLAVERQDIGEQLTENKLDTLYWASQRSWHEGEGQRRLDVPEISSDYRYFDSKGIDIQERGQATLQKAMTRILALTNTLPLAPQKMVATDTHVFVASGQPNVKRFANLDASDAVNVPTASAQETLDFATDGGLVYAALGTDGTHRYGLPTEVEEETFNATTGWSGTDLTFSTVTGKVGNALQMVNNQATQIDSMDSVAGWTIIDGASGGSIAADTAVKQQGTASLRLTKTSGGTLTARKTFAAVDYSAVDAFKVWFRRSLFAKGVYITFWTNPGTDGFSIGQLLDLPTDTWVEMTLTKELFVTIGAADWANITAIEVGMSRNSSTANAYFDDIRTTVARTASKTVTENWATIDQFKLWLYGTWPNTGQFYYANGQYTVTKIPNFKVRFQTSAGNYFEHTIVDMPINAWVEHTISRTAAFTTVGTPNWNNITSIQILPPGGATIWADSLRTITAATTFAGFSSADARVLGWGKDRVYGAGIKTGTQWRFFEVISDSVDPSGAVERYILPDGWTVTDIVELGEFIYFSAYRGNKGQIYAWDGTQIFQALPPDGLGGDIPYVMVPFGGVGMIVGCRRPTAVSSGGLGSVQRAFPNSAGHLQAERVHVIGEADGRDYVPRCGFSFLEHVHYGWNYMDASASGLGLYLPDTGSYSRYQHAGQAGIVVDALPFKGRHLVSIDGFGVYAEQDTYVSEGQLTSSAIDLNIDADKTWLAIEAAYDTLPTGSSIQLEYSTDGGDTWTIAGETTTGTRYRVPLNLKTRSIQYRVSLRAGTGATSSPTLYAAGIGGWPAAAPGAVHTLMVRAYDEARYRTGQQRTLKGGGYDVLADLITLRNAALTLDYQPPWYMLTETALKVRIAGLSLLGPWGTTGSKQGGVIKLVLKEVPA